MRKASLPFRVCGLDLDPILVTRDGAVATVAGVLLAVLIMVTYVPITGMGLVELFYR